MYQPASDAAFRQERPSLRLVRDEESPTYDGCAPVASYVKVPAGVLFRADLTPWARLAYMALLHHQGPKGIIPRRQVVAAEIGTSLRVLDRALDELCHAGLLRKERRGQGRANSYELPSTATERVIDSTSTATLDLPPVATERIESPSMATLESPSTATPYRTITKELNVNPPNPPRAKPPPFPEGFDAFWSSYPKKKAKLDAEKAWAKLRPDAALQQTMATALAWQAQSRDWTKEDGQFIPNAATWLNGRRWEDAPPATNGHVAVSPTTGEPLKPEWLGLDWYASRYQGSEGIKRWNADLAGRKETPEVPHG